MALLFNTLLELIGGSILIGTGWLVVQFFRLVLKPRKTPSRNNVVVPHEARELERSRY